MRKSDKDISEERQAASHSVTLVKPSYYGRSRGKHQGHLPELLGLHSGSMLHTEQQDNREALSMCSMVTWDQTLKGEESLKMGHITSTLTTTADMTEALVMKKRITL